MDLSFDIRTIIAVCDSMEWSRKFHSGRLLSSCQVQRKLYPISLPLKIPLLVIDI